MNRVRIAITIHLCLAVAMAIAAIHFAHAAAQCEAARASSLQAAARSDRDLSRRYALVHADYERTRSDYADWGKAHPLPDDVKNAELLESWRQARLDPKYQVMSEATYRSGLGLRYAALYRKLGLTPAQQKAFEDVEVEFRSRQDDINAATEEENEHAHDAERSQLTAMNKKDQQAAETNLLGADGAAAVRAFNDGQPAKYIVSDLAEQLYFGKETLSDDQASGLAGILQSSAIPESDPTAGKNLNSWASGNLTDWDLVEKKAAPLLSPAQRAQLNSEAEQGRFRDLQRQIMVRADAWERDHPVQPDGH